MGKNKNKNNKKPQKVISKGTLASIFGTAGEAVNNAPKDIENVSVLDDVQTNIDLLLSAEGKLSEEEKNTFSQLLKDFDSAVAAYNFAKKQMELKTEEQEKRSLALNEREGKLDVRDNDLNVRAEGLKARENDLNEKDEFLKAEQRSIETRENAVQKREDEIELRDAEVKQRETVADAGFVAREAKWKKEAVDAANQSIVSAQAALDKKMKAYELAKAELEKNQEKCRIELMSYEEKKAALDEAKKDLKSYYDRELDEIVRGFDNSLDRLGERNKILNDQIAQFDDIRAELGGRSASEVNSMIKNLQDENSRLKMEIQRVGSAQYQGELEEKLQEYEDKCEDLTIKNSGLKKLCLDLRSKVMDIEGYKSQIMVLETHKKAMDEALKQLENKLNELTSKDANKEIFAEFVGIDARCSTPYNSFTNSTGSLSDFVNALGYELTQYTPSLFYTKETLQLFVGGLAMSRLLILQGISGTGKTKLAQAFSSIVGDGPRPPKGMERSSCIVPVQAGWRDNQDLLGYYNAFEKKFYEKPFSKGLYAASTPSFRDRLFFLILDEMNLSHPEQYFADFISAMEQANSVSDPFSVDLLSGIPDEMMQGNRWPIELHHGEKITVPSNVWFIGTANHDETTMEFADKTYDRAHVMVMEKNPPNVKYAPVNRGAAHWSASDLRDAFTAAQNSPEGKKQTLWVKNQLESLRDILKKEFGVSFGNRLERQIDNFVPVVCAAGGSQELALDHLIATKIARKGKITGLFGVQQESLEKLRKKIFEDIGLGQNSQTIKLLNEDIESKKRGV